MIEKTVKYLSVICMVCTQCTRIMSNNIHQFHNSTVSNPKADGKEISTAIKAIRNKINNLKTRNTEKHNSIFNRTFFPYVWTPLHSRYFAVVSCLSSLPAKKKTFNKTTQRCTTAGFVQHVYVSIFAANCTSCRYLWFALTRGTIGWYVQSVSWRCKA